MAIALDTDLRGLMAPMATDTGVRRGGGRPGGEDFVRSLSELREATAEADSAATTEVAPTALAIPLPFDPPAADVDLVEDGSHSAPPEAPLVDAAGWPVAAELVGRQELPQPLNTGPAPLPLEIQAPAGGSIAAGMLISPGVEPSGKAPIPARPLEPALSIAPSPKASAGSFVSAEPADPHSPEVVAASAPRPQLAAASDLSVPAEYPQSMDATVQSARPDLPTRVYSAQTADPPETLTGPLPSHSGASEPESEQPAGLVITGDMDMAEAVAPLVVPVAMPVSKGTGRPSESGTPEIPTLNTRPPGKKLQPTAEPASEPRILANAGSATAVFAALTSTAEVSSDPGATTQTLSPAISVSFAGGAPLPSSQSTIQASVPATFVPTHTALVAAPTDLVGIISKTAEDGQSDRVVVQLDPPELGRVSIDFKFDSQGIQHVTITSETPEAMRQLRQMHGELVQALERQGIGSQNMSFQHQQQNPHAQPERGSFHLAPDRAQTGQDGGPEILTTTHNLERPRISAGGRLDMKA